MYKIVYTKKESKDIPLIKAAGFTEKAKALIAILRLNPCQNPPAFEKLQGDLLGAYSRRINLQHRLVYQIYEGEKIVKIISLWSHYEF